jgi:osmotically-inducible protein OsmY
MSTMKTRMACASLVTLIWSLAGCATYDKCGLEGCPGDAKITSTVEAAFARHPDLGAPNEIAVQTLNHVVYLSGPVSDGNMRKTAESIASKIKGVTRVENSIYVTH